MMGPISDTEETIPEMTAELEPLMCSKTMKLIEGTFVTGWEYQEYAY